jgi:hypothetical protein
VMDGHLCVCVGVWVGGPIPLCGYSVAGIPLKTHIPRTHTHAHAHAHAHAPTQAHMHAHMHTHTHLRTRDLPHGPHLLAIVAWVTSGVVQHTGCRIIIGVGATWVMRFSVWGHTLGGEWKFTEFAVGLGTKFDGPAK